MDIWFSPNSCPLPASSEIVSLDISTKPVLNPPQAFYISAKLSAMYWISQVCSQYELGFRPYPIQYPPQHKPLSKFLHAP